MYWLLSIMDNEAKSKGGFVGTRGMWHCGLVYEQEWKIRAEVG